MTLQAIWRFEKPCDAWCADAESLYNFAGFKLAHLCRGIGDDLWRGQALCGDEEMHTGAMSTREACRVLCENLAGVRWKQ